MKKLLLPALVMLSVLGLTLVTSTVRACEKNATLISTGDGDMRIETGENIVWLIEIWVGNYAEFYGLPIGVPWTDVVVKDNLGAELELDPGFPFFITKGTVSYSLHGKSEAVHLVWEGFDLAYHEDAYLRFYVSTDHNPAGHQEYTSPGWYYLNSGPTMKFYVDGVQHSIEMNTIMIEVLMPD